jgi:N-acetylmuramic acid 6-phosphate (MurNAc-6-P) etherase
LADAAGTQSPQSLEGLVTEVGGAPDADYELRSTSELVALMVTVEESVPRAVHEAGAAISRAIDAIVARLAAIVSLLADVDAESARARLSDSNGNVRLALRR